MYVIMMLMRAYLDSFNSHKDGAVISTDLIRLSFPNLAKVSLTEDSLKSQPVAGELPD